MKKPTTPLRFRREKVGKTQLQLAAEARVSIQTISIAERGGPLTAAMAVKLAAVLGCDPRELRS